MGNEERKDVLLESQCSVCGHTQREILNRDAYMMNTEDHGRVCSTCVDQYFFECAKCVKLYELSNLAKSKPEEICFACFRKMDLSDAEFEEWIAQTPSRDNSEVKQETRSPLERKKTLAINEVDEGICDISKVIGFPYRIMRYIHPYPNAIKLVVFARLGLATRQRIKTVIANLTTDLDVLFSDYSGDIISPVQ